MYFHSKWHFSFLCVSSPFNVSHLIDQTYAQQREFRRLQNQQNQQSEGNKLLTGIVTGGESVVRGIAEGISGIVVRPAEGAMNEGFSGFLKGVGRGVLGVVVKPVVGVADAAVSVIEGISSTAAVSKGVHRPIRLRRPVPYNPRNRCQVVNELDEEAVALNSLLKEEQGEIYVGHTPVEGHDTIYAIVVVLVGTCRIV